MAKFNEILAGRYNRFLQKLFGMKGGPPSAQLATEIGTTVSLFTGVENRWLEQWNRFACVSAQPATAAVASQIRIRNPKGSKVIAVIEKMTFSSSVTDNGAILTQITGAVDFAGAPGNRCLDNRATTGALTTLGPVLRVSNQQAVLAATGGIITQWNSLVSTPQKELIVHEDQELTLLPDDAITFFGTTLNCQVVVVIWWRERAMEESEQT